MVNELMERYKFPQPIIVDSGNGFRCCWKAFNAPAATLWHPPDSNAITDSARRKH
jgi:hypothetical protein